MKNLKSFQRKYLRGLTHKVKPVVLIGQKGLTDKVLRSTEQVRVYGKSKVGTGSRI
ncbi:MAG: YhbY family RNA-binding protein [Deltaproteobacteria bacterium]|nr:YhbY family RNA-binding protein [Deltaproteobacteria bacterium]